VGGVAVGREGERGGRVAAEVRDKEGRSVVRVIWTNEGIGEPRWDRKRKAVVRKPIVDKHQSASQEGRAPKHYQRLGGRKKHPEEKGVYA